VRASRRTLAILAAAAIAVGGVAACSPPSRVDPTPSTSGPVTGLTAEMVQVTGGIKDTPQVTFPVPSSATALSSKDVIVGTGAQVTATSTITFNYVGIGAESGTTFDSSYERGEPITFALAKLIPGWQQGLPGIAVGGRRVLVIPGELAYGANPPPGSNIQPNETLVFVLDIVAID